MKIEPIKSVAKLQVESTRLDIYRDLHAYITYVSEREVKRAHRGNGFSKTDERRLAKLLSDPDAETDLEESGYSAWVYFIDGLAHDFDFVSYDTDGVYEGYSSQEPVFPDNFIEFNEPVYNKWLSSSAAKREQTLFQELLQRGQAGASEFFSDPYIRSRLDSFSSWGSGIGVVPKLKFSDIRMRLFEYLRAFPTGEWLSVASFVEQLKTHDRYFLIPEKPFYHQDRSRKRGRYGNFHESKTEYGQEIQIDDSQPDAFERVEGRYIERFLEGLPCLMNYVDVAYGPSTTKLFPSLGRLRAFRVHDRLQRAMEGKIAEASVRVAPNFEIYLQSEQYPASEIRELSRIADHVTSDTTDIFRLDKQRVAAACADQPDFDPVALLNSLSSEPLPDNVAHEVADWAKHGDKFVLYSGYSLLETNLQKADIKKFLVENVCEGIDIVKSSKQLFYALEKQYLAPLSIEHVGKSFAAIPEHAHSVFPKKSGTGKKASAVKTKVALMRIRTVQLICPDADLFARLQKELIDASCPVEVDRQRLSISFDRQYEAAVNKAIGGLKNVYQIKIKDQ